MHFIVAATRATAKATANKKKTEEKTDMEGSRRSLPFHIFCLLIFTNSHR